MAVEEETGELERLRSQLDAQARAAADKERQLEVYAADLRETFKQERAVAQELRRSYRATVRALANAVEARDAYTGKHAERVAAYGLEIAAAVGLNLAAEPQMEFGFLLHDIGKVAVPDSILFKPAGLSPEEEALMRLHPVIGAEIVREIDFLGSARDVIRHHHEHWDGSGYPDGLAGEAIPLAARVFAVSDAFDALTTDRPYRPGQTFAAARIEIARVAGEQFDPAVVEAFMAVSDERLNAIRAEIG